MLMDAIWIWTYNLKSYVSFVMRVKESTFFPIADMLKVGQFYNTYFLTLVNIDF